MTRLVAPLSFDLGPSCNSDNCPVIHIIVAKHYTMGQKQEEDPELDDYERQRQENIAQRNKLLKDLALDARAAGLAPKRAQDTNAKSKSTSHKKRKPAAKKIEDNEPRRTSSRLQGLVADSEVAKRKAEEEHVAVQEAARIKRQRKTGDMNLGDVIVKGESWDSSQNFLVDIMKRGANPYERTFGDTEIKSSSSKELRALREQMSNLELYEGFTPNNIKITEERIYSMGFHPTREKPIIFAGDKLGNLGLFDASQRSTPTTNGVKQEASEDDDDDGDVKPEITTFRTHTRTISSFQFSPINQSHLYTASYDSSLRLLDLEKSKSVEIYGPEDASLDEPLSGVEIDTSNPHMVYFSRLDGYVGRVDTRAKARSTDLYELSEKKIGGFTLHPAQPHFVATASLDRYLRIWDLRKLSGKVGRQLPALIGEHESRLSVSHAAFNSAGQVATASYDDSIKIHTFDGISGFSPGHKIGEEGMKPSALIRHNNQTGRWVTM